MGVCIYLGCYNNFETVSVSNLSYITPENTGVSQFPLEILDVLVNAPINMFVNQVTNGTVIYLDGGVSGRYLTTTTDLAAAVAVYAEKVEGGYKFYILGEDGAKLYITIYNNADGKTSVNYDAAGETVYTYNPTVNAWTTVFGGKEVYLGTYNNFATISVSNLSYITPENTGVSQFPLDIVAGTPDTEEHTCEFVAGETKAPTCTEDGYTVYTCSCGKTENRDVVTASGHTWTDATCVAPKTCSVCLTTEGEALGHNFVDGTCANGCGTTEEHVCEFVASDKVVDPTCTDAGYTVYTCTCGLTENRDHVDALGHDEITTTTPATCAAAGSTVVECDRCKEVLSTTPIEQLAHVDADGDFKCDAECGAVVEPAADSVLTIEQALALGALYAKDTYTTNKYYVTGTIKNVYQTTYGNMYITDASGKELCVYGTYDATGATRYDNLEYKPVTGDEVTVYGVIGFYTAAQMKNGWLDEIVAHEHDYVASVTEATCTSAGFTTHTCSVCGDNYKDAEVPALGHTTDDGVCDNCGNTIGGETAVSEYVKVTSADQFTTGTYVLIVSTKNVTVSTFDGSWIKGSELAAGDTIDKSTGDTLAITLEVNGSSVKIKIGGQYVKPKSGNNNGIQAGSYDWAYEFKEDGTIVFKGVGSDTTILAYNVGSSGFRAYKTSTVTGNPSGYPSTFTVYKLVEG